jgi:hypothetical protein
MRNVRSLAGILLLSVLFVALIGCGEQAEDGEEESSTDEFRIPDSLLAPIQGYKLTRDDYHPIDGGVMANKDIVLYYPASTIARYIAIKIFGMARNSLRIVTQQIDRPAAGRITLLGSKDLDEYKFLTRKEWWYYGVIQGDSIYFEPLDIMIKRGIAQMGITQRMAQMALHRISNGRLPLWLKESVASYVAGEKEVIMAQVEEFRFQNWDINPLPSTLERDLSVAEVRADTRIAFGAAFRMLENLLQFSTIENVLRFARLLGAGDSLDEASREVFGCDYQALVDRVRVDTDQ